MIFYLVTLYLLQPVHLCQTVAQFRHIVLYLIAGRRLFWKGVSCKIIQMNFESEVQSIENEYIMHDGQIHHSIGYWSKTFYELYHLSYVQSNRSMVFYGFLIKKSESFTYCVSWRLLSNLGADRTIISLLISLLIDSYLTNNLQALSGHTNMKNQRSASNLINN